MSDANKTEITRKVTTAAATWLTERGFRPVESEVPVADRWVADVAGFCYPTRTEAIKLKLLSPRPSYHKGETTELYKKWHADYRRLPVPLTAIVEVKTSLSDFRRDTKFDRTSPANLLYLAIPSKLISPDKVPEHWGILSYDAAGRVKRVRTPKLHWPSHDEAINVVAQIAIRRDSFTAYERQREFNRQAAEDTNARVNRKRLGAVINVVHSVVSGEHTIDEAADIYCGTHVRFSDRDRKRLAEIIESLRPATIAAEPAGDEARAA